FLFFARDADPFGVDHDNEIAGVDMRRKNCFLFPAQELCRLDRNTPEDLIFSVDQPPFTVDLTGFGGKRLHRRLEKGPETTGRGVDCQPAESSVIRASKVLYGNYNAPRYSSRFHRHFLSQLASCKGAC